MFKITVTKGKFVVAVYFNSDAARGEMIARMEHGSRCKYRVEVAA